MISNIGNLLKQNYRIYSRGLLSLLEEQGYSDIRASFLEILIYLSLFKSNSIKEIGDSCQLKKQTMTSHLNAIEKRGYIKRVNSLNDKRQQTIVFTKQGDKLKFALLSCLKKLEKEYYQKFSIIELERIQDVLLIMNRKLKLEESKQGAFQFQDC